MTVGEFWLPSETLERGPRAQVIDAAASGSSTDPPADGLGDGAEAEEAAAAERPTGGMCRIERDVIEVDVVGELTPRSIRVADGIQMRTSPAAERIDFTVHGSLPVEPWSVSFLACRTVSRRANALGMFTGTNAHQVVHATWAVAGAHVTAETTYSSFRLQVTGLEE